MKFNIIPNRGQVFNITLLVQLVDNDYSVVRIVLPKVMDEVRTNEASASGDKNSHTPISIPVSRSYFADSVRASTLTVIGDSQSISGIWCRISLMAWRKPS